MAPEPNIVKTYYVFLASPGDMPKERKDVKKFFDDYNRNTASFHNLNFEVVDWENYATIGLGRPQELITKKTLEEYKESLVLFIGLLGQRFGTPTDKYESGTEEEFETAIEFRIDQGEYPEIKWFFRTGWGKPPPTDNDLLDKVLAQKKKVDAFKEQYEASEAMFSASFEKSEDFLSIFRPDLERWLNDPERAWVRQQPKLQGRQALPPKTKLTLGKAKKLAQYIDRQDQLGDLNRFFQVERPQGAPILALLSCTSMDRQSILRTRLEDGEKIFDPDSNYANILPAFDIFDVQFPSNERLSTMQERLRTQISAKSSMPMDIRNALNELAKPDDLHSTVIYSTISNKTGVITLEREQLINKWIKFWEDVATKIDTGGRSLNHLVIVIICVVTDSEQGQLTETNRTFMKKIFGRKKQQYLLKDWVDEWHKLKSSSLHLERFTELSKIEQVDVNTWLRTIGKYQNKYTQAAEESLIDTQHIVSIYEGVTMAEFFDSCLQKLSIVEKTGE